MSRRKQIFKGRTKTLYSGDTPDTLVLHFRDDFPDVQNDRKASLEGKGILNNRISEHIMKGLLRIGIPTHILKRLNMREQVVRALDMIPLHICVRNLATRSIAERFGIKEAEPLPRPLIEFYLKDPKLGFPMVTEEHLIAFGVVSPPDLDEIFPLAFRTNDYLSGMMAGIGLLLADFTLEVGRFWDDDGAGVRLIVADELSPDVFRLWDTSTGKEFVSGSEDTKTRPKSTHAELSHRLGILAETGKQASKPRLVS